MTVRVSVWVYVDVAVVTETEADGHELEDVDDAVEMPVVDET